MDSAKNWMVRNKRITRYPSLHHRLLGLSPFPFFPSLLRFENGDAFGFSPLQPRPLFHISLLIPLLLGRRGRFNRFRHSGGVGGSITAFAAFAFLIQFPESNLLHLDQLALGEFLLQSVDFRRQRSRFGLQFLNVGRFHVAAARRQFKSFLSFLLFRLFRLPFFQLGLHFLAERRCRFSRCCCCRRRRRRRCRRLFLLRRLGLI